MKFTKGTFNSASHIYIDARSFQQSAGAIANLLVEEISLSEEQIREQQEYIFDLEEETPEATERLLSFSSMQTIYHPEFHFPYIVNLGLACELYLKALLTASNKDYPKGSDGHNLQALFKELPLEIVDQIQRFLLCHYSEKSEDFQNALEEAKECFIDWRYWYEKRKSSVDIVFLECFCEILSQIAEEKIPVQQLYMHPHSYSAPPAPPIPQ